MTPIEYIKHHKLKALTKKEIKKGKESLCISNREDPMPWGKIYDKLRLSVPIEHIADEFGHGRKIALWAVRDKIETSDTLTEIMMNDVKQRNIMKEVANINPSLATTMIEVVNEYAPDLRKDIALLNQALIKKAAKMVRSGEVTTHDLKNIADMVQKTSDTSELTQRHASASQTTNNTQITEYDVVLDYQAPNHQEVIEHIDAEIEEKNE